MARIPLGVPEVSLLKTPEFAKLLRPHQMPNVPLLDGSLWDPAGEGGEVDSDESFSSYKIKRSGVSPLLFGKKTRTRVTRTNHPSR